MEIKIAFCPWLYQLQLDYRPVVLLASMNWICLSLRNKLRTRALGGKNKMII